MIDWNKESQGGGGGFKIYAEGTYKVECSEYEPCEASTGTPQIKWRVKIVEPVSLSGSPFTTFTTLTEASYWKIARLVKAFGIDMSSLGKMEVNSPAFYKVLNACKGRTAYWHLVVLPSTKGRNKNEVDDFKVDPDLEPIQIHGSDDIPEFLKEE